VIRFFPGSVIPNNGVKGIQVSWKDIVTIGEEKCGKTCECEKLYQWTEKNIECEVLRLLEINEISKLRLFFQVDGRRKSFSSIYERKDWHASIRQNREYRKCNKLTPFFIGWVRPLRHNIG